MESSTVMPKELRLATPSTMPQCRSYLFPIQSTEQVYDTGSNVPIIINIPRLGRSYLRKDSYIRFRLDMKSVNTDVAFDLAGAMGLFKTIEVYDYLGSTLLEKIDNVPELWTLLLQMRNDLLDTNTGGSISTAIDGAAAFASFVQAEGCTFYKASTPTTSTSFEFCIPLFCFLGTLSNKYVPLHNGYTIQLTMNTNNLAFNSSTALSSSPEVSNMYLYAQVLELGPDAESMVLGSLSNDPFVIPSNTYRHYSSALKAGVYNQSIPLNLNVASLNTILLIQRPSNYANANTNSLSTRTRNYLQTATLRYGSSSLPTTRGIQCSSLPGSTISIPYDKTQAWTPAIDGGYTEAWHELCKATRKNPYKSCNIDRQSFVNTSFAVGLSTRLLEDRENDVVCGLNTNGMYTTVDLQYDSRQTTNAVKIDLWAEYNMFVSVSPGIATTVAF